MAHDPSRALEQGLQDVNEAGTSALRRDFVPPGSRPPVLYHFTDVTGLMGILRQKCLWASYARSLNDPSELLHGITVAKSVLKQGIAGVSPAFCSDVTSCLDGKQVFDSAFNLEWRPYLISFSEGHEHATHWLHYGRDGTGYAIGIIPDAITASPFDLIQVLYDEARQSELVSHIVARLHSTLMKGQQDLDAPERDALTRATIHMTATFLSAAAVRMKHRAFADEREWRLVTNELVINGVLQQVGTDLPKDWRAVAGRAVPYFIHKPAGRFVTSLVRGWSASMSEDDPALRMLLNEHALTDVTVATSIVSVRP